MLSRSSFLTKEGRVRERERARESSQWRGICESEKWLRREENFQNSSQVKGEYGVMRSFWHSNPLTWSYFSWSQLDDEIQCIGNVFICARENKSSVHPKWLDRVTYSLCSGRKWNDCSTFRQLRASQVFFLVHSSLLPISLKITLAVEIDGNSA